MEEGLGWTGSERRRRICRELGGETRVSVEQGEVLRVGYEVLRGGIGGGVRSIVVPGRIVDTSSDKRTVDCLRFMLPFPLIEPKSMSSALAPRRGERG
jgi:hypothetical protein